MSAVTHLVNSGAGLRTQMLRLHVQALTPWAIQPPNDSKDVYVPGTVASVASVLHIKKWDTLTMVTTEIFPADTWHWWIKHLWFELFFMAPYVWVCVCAHTCVYVHVRAHLFACGCACVPLTRSGKAKAKTVALPAVSCSKMNLCITLVVPGEK